MSNDYILQVNDLKVKFNAQTVLQKVSFAVAASQIVTIVGPNGGGKSTLVRAILGLVDISGGQIIKRDNLRFGYVPQKVSFGDLIPLTVERFLQLGGTKLIKVADLVGRIKLDSLMPKYMQNLSGGELQRVLLARALLTKPEILILDEPVQGVDITGQIEFYDLLKHICSDLKTAILLVSHDLHFVMADTDSVICINKHVCCKGKPRDVAEHREFKNIFGQSFADKLTVYQHYHNHTHNWDDDADI